MELLLKLYHLLSTNREAIEIANTEDTLTSIATNRENMDRGLATIKAYAENKSTLKQFNTNGVAIYSCYGDPSFGLFGMTLAPALIACGTNKPICIGFPSILQKYKTVVEAIFKSSPDFANISFSIGRASFCEQIETESKISDIIIFGDEWITKCMSKAILHQKNMIFYGPGNNSSIILASANMQQAVKKTLESAFILNGQAAVCINRVIIDERINKKEIKEIFVKELAKISFGTDAFRNQNYVTPIKIKPLVDLTERMVRRSVSETSELINYKTQQLSDGVLIEPSLVWNCDCKTDLFKHYHFTPVLPICFANADKIENILNESNYGIYNSFWGSENDVFPIKEKVEQQNIKNYINEGILDEITPKKGYTGSWGGYKNSGFILNKNTAWKPQEGSFHLLDLLQQN